jgi:energy-coupling factor transporter transmembrane protein EcfT
MDLSQMKSFVVENPLLAAGVAVVAVLLYPVVVLAAIPVLQFLLVQLAPVLVPALLLAVVGVTQNPKACLDVLSVVRAGALTVLLLSCRSVLCSCLGALQDAAQVSCWVPCQSEAEMD